MATGVEAPLWAFRASPPAENLREDIRRFRAAARVALRVAHGLGAGVRFVRTSGPDGAIECEPLSPLARRWFVQALLPLYDRGQWTAAPPVAPTATALRWRATRVRPWPVPLRTEEDEAAALDVIDLALRLADRGVRLEWSFRPLPLSFRTPALPTIVDGPAPGRTGARLSRSFGSTAAPPPPSPAEPCFWSSRLDLVAPTTPGGAAAVARAVESAVRSGLGNGIRFRRPMWSNWLVFPWVVSDAELALVVPTPRPGTATATGGSSSPPVPRVVLGRTEAGAVVGAPIDPAQGRHLAVLGETGMGKSSLLVAIGRRATEVAGVILFDPLGETAESFYGSLATIERSRTTRLTPLSPPGLNALAGVGASDADAATRERRLNDLVHALRRVRSGRYVDASYWGPRLEEMLQRALTVAAAIPSGTLEDAHLLLASGGRGFRQLPPNASDAANGLAERIRARPEDAEGARRLLYEVVRSPVLVRALCRRTPRSSLPDLVAPGRILVLSGDAARVGETTARFFLSVYLALLWSTLLARPGGAKSFVLLDEAQWFAHESLAEMLRLGRRRNLHVILATQSVASLPEEVGDAVWTNVADFVAFRGAPAEAREFSRLVRGLSPESILALPRGQAAALIGKGEIVQWIRTARRPPAPPAPPGSAVPAARDPGDPVVRAILRRLGASDVPGPVRVPVRELRDEADPGGAGVRSVGGRLGRAGAIVRVERGAMGTVWWVDPARARDALELPAAGEVSDDADVPQPS